MFIQMFVCIGFISIPLFFIGFETWGKNHEVEALCVSGPFRKKLPKVKELIDPGWNKSVLTLYFLTLRVSRAVQFLLITVVSLYLWSAFQVSSWVVGEDMTVVDIAFKTYEDYPTMLKFFFGTAALSYTLGIFNKISFSYIDKEIKRIKNEY